MDNSLSLQEQVFGSYVRETPATRGDHRTILFTDARFIIRPSSDLALWTRDHHEETPT